MAVPELLIGTDTFPMKAGLNINLNHLFYFWKVAHCGSITEAAIELGLTQPTLSAQLKALESAIGELLLIRKGRSLRLTAHGEIALRYSDKIFGLREELTELFSGDSHTLRSKVRIGVADVVPKVLTHRLTHSIFKNHPDTKLVFLEDSTERLLTQLATRELDLVISDSPIPPSINAIAYNHLLFRSGISFFLSRSQMKGTKMSLISYLEKFPVLLPTHHSSLRREIDRWLHDNHLKVRNIHEFQDSALMKLFGAHGEGIYPAPQSLESDILKDGDQICIGRIKEHVLGYYLISTQRKNKQPLISEILEAGHAIR